MQPRARAGGLAGAGGNNRCTLLAGGGVAAHGDARRVILRTGRVPGARLVDVDDASKTIEGHRGECCRYVLCGRRIGAVCRLAVGICDIFRIRLWHCVICAWYRVADRFPRS